MTVCTDESTSNNITIQRVIGVCSLQGTGFTSPRLCNLPKQLGSLLAYTWSPLITILLQTPPVERR